MPSEIIDEVKSHSSQFGSSLVKSSFLEDHLIQKLFQTFLTIKVLQDDYENGIENEISGK